MSSLPFSLDCDVAAQCDTTVGLAASHNINLHRSKQIRLTFSSTGTTSTCRRKKVYAALVAHYLCCLCFCIFFYFVLGHIHFKRCSQRDCYNGGERKDKFLISWLSSCLSDVLESSCMATPKAVCSICIMCFLCR